MAELDPEVRALLKAPNFVHLATLMPDGSPHSVAIWGDVDDTGHVVFFTQPNSRKAKNIEHNPRVALSVVDRANPYRTGRVRGRVVEVITGDAALKIIDHLSLGYTGAPFPMRSGQVYRVEVESSGLMALPFEDTPPVG
jgi:PPOX class probable F420-dependent enzyme